jgi:hypothetical protein
MIKTSAYLSYLALFLHPAQILSFSYLSNSCSFPCLIDTARTEGRGKLLSAFWPPAEFLPETSYGIPSETIHFLTVGKFQLFSLC